MPATSRFERGERREHDGLRRVVLHGTASAEDFLVAVREQRQDDDGDALAGHVHERHVAHVERHRVGEELLTASVVAWATRRCASSRALKPEALPMRGRPFHRNSTCACVRWP
jgi:hypothetical protein